MSNVASLQSLDRRTSCAAPPDAFPPCRCRFERRRGSGLGSGRGRHVPLEPLIPYEEGCYGCGRYDDATYQPAVHTGLLLSQQVHRYLLIQTGARFAVAMSFFNRATDIHNFIPGLLAWHLDAGLAVPLF